MSAKQHYLSYSWVLFQHDFSVFKTNDCPVAHGGWKLDWANEVCPWASEVMIKSRETFFSKWVKNLVLNTEPFALTLTPTSSVQCVCVCVCVGGGVIEISQTSIQTGNMEK